MAERKQTHWCNAAYLWTTVLPIKVSYLWPMCSSAWSLTVGFKCLAQGQLISHFLRDWRVLLNTLSPHPSCHSIVGCHQDLCLNHVVWLWLDSVVHLNIFEGVWTGWVWQHSLLLYLWARARQQLTHADRLTPPCMHTQCHGESTLEASLINYMDPFNCCLICFCVDTYWQYFWYAIKSYSAIAGFLYWISWVAMSMFPPPVC